MSRHRKQQIKRFQMAVARIPAEHASTVVYRLNMTGRFPHWATPLDRIAIWQYPDLYGTVAGMYVDRPLGSRSNEWQSQAAAADLILEQL